MQLLDDALSRLERGPLYPFRDCSTPTYRRTARASPRSIGLEGEKRPILVRSGRSCTQRQIMQRLGRDNRTRKMLSSCARDCPGFSLFIALGLGGCVTAQQTWMVRGDGPMRRTVRGRIHSNLIRWLKPELARRDFDKS